MLRGLGAVNQGSGLENANFIFISCCYLASVCAAVERRYTNVIVDGAWNDLHSLESAG